MKNEVMPSQYNAETGIMAEGEAQLPVEFATVVGTWTIYVTKRYNISFILTFSRKEQSTPTVLIMTLQAIYEELY